MPSRVWFGLALVVAFVLGARPGTASYRNARATGKRCATCHASPHPGLADLNVEGRAYLATRRLPQPGQDLPGLERARPTQPAAAAETDAARPDVQSGLGAAVFERACVPCHGAQGVGGEVVAPLRAPLRHGASAPEIEQVVREGLSDTDMFGFAALLADDEIEAVAEYVRRLAAR